MLARAALGAASKVAIVVPEAGTDAAAGSAAGAAGFAAGALSDDLPEQAVKAAHKQPIVKRRA
ncbi:MAG: hypothetical protein H7061_03975 [Bdellovibrionaceae bacterium]|nr:hypothetical protein [Bdellovibrio sp.]